MVTPVTIRSFAMYAEHRLTLGPGNRVEGGDIGVRSRSPESDGAQLIVGTRSRILPDHEVIAPSVTLGDDVGFGRILTDVLVDHGIPLRSEYPFPSSAMPTLPLAAATSSGSQAVVVAQGQKSALAPGSYGDVTVHGSLVLDPGDYVFSSITIGDLATMAAAGTVRVMVVNYLNASRGARLLPLSGHAAGQLRILVAGTDPATTLPVVSVGEHAEVRALLGAPHGTVALADHAHVTGAVAGYAIVTGEKVAVRYEDGFAENPPGQRGSQQLSGAYGVPAGPGTAPVAGPVPAGTGISLSIGLPVRDNAGLQALIASVSDPKSPRFRQYISPDAFNATYGATSDDYQALRDWATAAGFTTVATFPNNLLLRVTGTAAQVQQALFVNLFYRARADGSLFVATDRDLSLNLPVPVLEINGLGDAVRPVLAQWTGTGMAGSYRAADLRNAYLGVGSPLQALDGSGQNVGILGFVPFTGSDITGYFTNQVPAQGEDSPLPPPNVTLAEVQPPAPPPGPPAGSGDEANLDVEMVYAMAPKAAIYFFQGGDSGQLAACLHRMATFSPQLTVVSCSVGFGRSDNAQQALDQMALLGISFFTGSGDDGDTADILGSRKMRHQTLVGGTMLTTHPLDPWDNYPVPYYRGEDTWQGSGGGVMPDVPIPAYQVGIMQVSASANGGSTLHRNYPDVAMVADGAEYYTGGDPDVGGGTSLAAPLWAGLTALINQMSLQNNAGLMGFLNPTLYDIGLTRGAGGNADLYAQCFNDIQDDVSNGGFRSVPGYDLVTGLGTPRSALIYQLATPAPTLPREYHLIRFVIGTGDDDLRKDSAATADVFLKNGGQFTVTLKDKDVAEWKNGTAYGPFDFQIPPTVTLPTPAAGLSGVRINLTQGDTAGDTDDNWDINLLEVILVEPGSEQAVQINLVGDSQLEDGSTGLVRLSRTAGSSGVGPSSPIFAAGPRSGG